LHDGRSFTGLLAAESAMSITLRMPQGKEEPFARDAIEEIVPSKLSLMPQGLEKTITRPEFADLLAYLKGEAIALEQAAPANTQ
jgi:putative heme-binding domain-containing protein